MAAFMGGCDSSSSTGPAGTGRELGAGTGSEPAVGSYFILSDSEDVYTYEQYFVVQSGHRWEFVEYGYTPSAPETLCLVSRQRGVYSSTDSSLILTKTEEGDLMEKCGMTKADFDAYPFQAAPAGSTTTARIRKVTANRFEAEDLFDWIAPGWRAFYRKADPFGFF